MSIYIKGNSKNKNLRLLQNNVEVCFGVSSHNITKIGTVKRLSVECDAVNLPHVLVECYEELSPEDEKYATNKTFVYESGLKIIIYDFPIQYFEIIGLGFDINRKNFAYFFKD
jgi:hypothetical protein